MTDLTSKITLEGFPQKLVYDHANGLFYFTDHNAIYSFNPQTGHVVRLFRLHGLIGSFAISADGTRLIIGRNDYIGNLRGVHQGTVLSVPVSTVSDPSTYTIWHYNGAEDEFGVADIAVTSENKILMATFLNGYGGYVPLRYFPISTVGTIPDDILTNVVNRAALLQSENGRYVFIQEIGISDGAMEIFDAQANAIIASRLKGEFNAGVGDVNEAVGLIADDLYVYDIHFHILKDLLEDESVDYDDTVDDQLAEMEKNFMFGIITTTLL